MDLRIVTAKLRRNPLYAVFLLGLSGVCLIKVFSNSSSSITNTSIINATNTFHLTKKVKELQTQLHFARLTFNHSQIINENVIRSLNVRINDLEAQLQNSVPRSQVQVTCEDEFLKTFQTEKRFLCSNSNAGLGNYMFSFASAYGIADVTNKTVLIEKGNALLKHFTIKAAVIDHICVCDFAEIVYEEKHCAFSESLFQLKENTNYYPQYYLQSWMYFRHVRNDIKRQFTFDTSIVQKSERLMKASLQTLNTTVPHNEIRTIVKVGVHVRRGDIITYKPFVDYGYLTPPVQYFKKAMHYFRLRYRHVVFFVCSEDVVWCKENITGNDVIIMEEKEAPTIMSLLSYCDHMIMSVGTFGWWAAFLASGETIYYKHPARNGTELWKQFSDDLSDFYPHEWIGME